MKEQVKQLWRRCFSDSEAFVDLYFRLRYTNDVNMAIRSGREVIAALQLLPYPMTCGGEVLPTAYVSGACTHPDYRGRGVMRELLSEALTRLWRDGTPLSTLIPAEPWLFDYYARSGYAPVFRTARTTFTDTGGALPADTPLLEETCDYRPDDYALLDRCLRARPCCILHTEEDYRVLLADLRLGGGFVATLRRDGLPLALAVVYPDGHDGWRVAEAVSADPALRHRLLLCLCRRLGQSALTVLEPADEAPTDAVRPLGMMRVVDAHRLLRLYAGTHPEADVNIALTDEQLTANSGYYYIIGGKCTHSPVPLPGGKHLRLTPDGLARWLFADRAPYMSLMMD